MERSPFIVDVKRNSLEDGPGIRSVVFFKGCPLGCVFCHNPETREPGPEIMFSPRECVGCGDCAAACPENAISLESPWRIRRTSCNLCGACVEACPGKGLRRVGARYTVEDLGELLLRDRAYYKHSGGGVTLSGGECTLYPDYLEALLRFLQASGIHVLLETSGFFNYDAFRERILPHVDEIYLDLKFASPRDHIRYTGRSNRTILGNFRRLIRENGVTVTPRIPLVAGITATRKNLAGIAAILRAEGIREAVLLPYNPMGMEKYRMLGKPAPPVEEHFMPVEEEEALTGMFRTMMEGESRPLTPGPGRHSRGGGNPGSKPRSENNPSFRSHA